MQLFRSIAENIERYKNRNAFFIQGVFYTYAELGKRITQIRTQIRTIPEDEKTIGVWATDAIETYASIFAIWFEGRIFVPLHPDAPKERNERILHEAGIKYLLSHDPVAFATVNVISTGAPGLTTTQEMPLGETANDLAYILFTSGTTGLPKGVPVSVANLTAFVTAFFSAGYTITEEDRFLQNFDLTFDLSFMCYLIPLLKGACCYTVPHNVIKFTYVYDLIEEQQLTVALMVPSTLHYLRPYFNEITAPAMRYSLFCGEALFLDVVTEWQKCVPNALVQNVYGPTENTIFCTAYTLNKDGENKAQHGVVSIGQPMKGTSAIVVDENDAPVPANTKGELCLAGPQLTPGYWNNEAKNATAFFNANHNGMNTRFYRTGDVCHIDEDGDIMYWGRTDEQVKIQCYRIELSEIEYFARQALADINVVAIAFRNKIGNNDLALFIESDHFPTDALKKKLAENLPHYMMPNAFKFIPSLPVNINGKTDRNALAKIMETENG